MATESYNEKNLSHLKRGWDEWKKKKEARSAAGDGRKAFDSNFARMKESMGAWIELWSLTDGSEGRANGRNDHQFSWRF